MQNLIDRIKLSNKSFKNRTFPFFFKKSNKNQLSKCQSEITAVDSDAKTPLKYLKRRVDCNGVLKKFLSPRNKNKSLTIEKKKWSEEIGKDFGTSGDYVWDGMSAASSLSSLIITGNFCTSSPVSERKLKQFNFQLDSYASKFDDTDNESDDNKVNENGSNFNKSQEEENENKYNTLQLPSGNFIRSKSDSEIFFELDCDNVAERIRELTRDDPLRQSFPGMSNTTRRESCHQLLKILLAQIDVNQHNKDEDEDTVDSKLMDETFDTFDSDLPNFSNSIEMLSPCPKKSMRDMLLEISSRRSHTHDKFYQYNTSEYDDENIQPNIGYNVLNISKSIIATADNFRDHIDKVTKRFESQKIVEDDEIHVEFNQSINSPIISCSGVINNCIYF